MAQLLCHLFGDYVLQNHWMATNKVKAWFPAAVHACVYMLPFLVVFMPSWPATAVMLLTHLVIDRLRLAAVWTEFYGVGNSGNVPLIADWSFGLPYPTWEEVKERNPKQRAPDWLAVWLLIIVDNTFHMTINFLSLKYL